MAKKLNSYFIWVMMIGISNITTFGETTEPGIINRPGLKLYVLATMGLFSFFTGAHQSSVYAESINNVKSHLSEKKAPLAADKTESRQVAKFDNEETELLLKEVSHDDLIQAQILAKSHFLQSWNVIAKRSRYVRYRLLRSLKQMEVPAFLQVVPIVESGYNPYALSRTGASGLWQLMPGTARELGLCSSNGRDGRRNVKHSTEASTQYLSLLHDRFHSWPLAIAAYNMGPNGLARRLKKSPWKSSDGLDNMPIPFSTRKYVQYVIGLAALLHKGEFSLPEPSETRMLLLQPPIDIIRLAQQTGMEKDEIFRLNPSLNQAQYLRRPVSIHVPTSKYSELKAKIKLSGPKYHQLIVHEGDSLWKIAQAINTSVGNLRSLNPGVITKLSIGQKLKVPANKIARASSNPNPLLSSDHRIRYKVRSGDSLWLIAHRFGTTPKAIARSNQLSINTLIRPGDTLWVLARL